MSKIVLCAILPIIILIVAVYGIAHPLKATGTLGFRIKYFFKTEESARFVRRTYGIVLLILDIFYCIYCFMIMTSTIQYDALYTLLILLGVAFIPLLFAIVSYFILFHKDGIRR